MNTTLLKFLPLMLLLLALTGCVKEQKKNTTVPEQFTNDVALDSFFTRLHQKGMFNGAVGIKQKGKLIFKKGYGTANFEMNTPFLPETAMEIASLSKQFTAMAILLLEQEHKLQLEDPIQKYLGEDIPYPTITIKHLISHTSGLTDYEDYFRKNWDTTKIAMNGDIVTYFKKMTPKLNSVPGKKYHYSNSGYILLAEIVHAISRMPLDDYLKDHVFNVTKMSETNFYDRDAIWSRANYAPGYRINPATCHYDKPEHLLGKYYYYFLSGRLGSGRLSSSVEDLLKWDHILYSNTLLSEEGKDLAFQAYPAEDELSDYGFGWHVNENDSIGKVVYHTGSWAGNLAYIKRNLSDRSLVIILNNTYSPYIKEIRASVEGYLKGEPLKMPQHIGLEVLRKELCNLDVANVVNWYQEHSDAYWDVDDLKAFSKTYAANGLEGKVLLINQLIKIIEIKD